MATGHDMRDPTLVGKVILASDNVPKSDIPLERDFSERSDYTITDHVLALHDEMCTNDRTKSLYASLIKHLHAFARETRLTHDEWEATVKSLVRAGQVSTPGRNEFILLSDCLGLSVLLEEQNHPRPPGCTPSVEEGPFWTDNPPVYQSGADLAPSRDIPGELLYFSGTIRNLHGAGIPNCEAVVWQSDGNGEYDVQKPAGTPAHDRGRILVRPDGSFNYRSRLPVAYPIPDNGPCGDMLKALGRFPHRASHLHFRIFSPGYDTLTTALYPSHSPFLGSDPVFATKKSLITDVVPVTDPAKWKEMGFDDEALIKERGGRVWAWHFDFVLPTEQELMQEMTKIR